MSVILSNKDGKLKQCFQRKTMPHKLQIDLASILTVLYCVTMMQAESSSIISRESMNRHNFGQTLNIQSAAVTLNIRSSSSKFN